MNEERYNAAPDADAPLVTPEPVSAGGMNDLSPQSAANPPAEPVSPEWQRPAGGASYGVPPYGTGGFSPVPPKKPKKNRGWIVALVILYAVLLVGVVLLIGSGTLRFVSGEGEGTGKVIKTPERTDNPPIEESTETDGKTIVGEGYTGEPMDAAELYANVVESVVFVQANYRNGYSTGSGFVIDSKNGYLLTNHHVVEDSDDLAVTFSNGDSYTATLVGGDAINDVAVLRIEAEGLKHVTVGSSEDARVGDPIAVIGNPLGDLTFTMTRGIVSGKDRNINTGEYTIRTFQTDAAINSGNSGGPAFDVTGAVIGIASAKYSANGVEGIGFCIPIEDAMAIARDLVEYGYVMGRPAFGISVYDAPGYIITTDEYGRRVKIETPYGALVEEVAEGSAAERAGLRRGDIITKLGDTVVEGSSQLINAKNRYKAGDTVSFEIWRNGETLTLEITFDEALPEE